MSNPDGRGNVPLAWVGRAMEPKQIVIRPLFKQERERLLALAREVDDRAAGLRPGSEQRKLLREARLLKSTADLDSWISSTGLARRSPRRR
jgi:hypothetical protein